MKKRCQQQKRRTNVKGLLPTPKKTIENKNTTPHQEIYQRAQWDWNEHVSDDSRNRYDKRKNWRERKSAKTNSKN